jgi:hypothetical protein
MIINIDFDLLIRYTIIGILSGYLLIYGLRPIMPYPELLVELFDQYWILLILLIINYCLLLWDLKIGVLMGLSIVAFILDIVLLHNN